MGIFSSKEPTQPNLNPRRSTSYNQPPSTTHNYSYRNEPHRDIFSEERTQPNRNRIYEPTPRPYTNYNRSPPSTDNYSHTLRHFNETAHYGRDFAALSPRFESLHIGGIRRCVGGPTRSEKNPYLVTAHTTGVVTYTPLDPYDPEYSQVTRMITNKRNFKVDSIQKIDNPYLEKAFQLKKQQKEKQFGYVEERLLFHGTKRANVGAICTYNFNWRLCRTHKYGKGVSFSPNSTYASVYSDENGHSKVMIVAKVLIGSSCVGNQWMELPPDGYDTTQKGDDGVVIVKFEDSEFYPAYKINYHVRDENVGKRRGNRNRRPKVAKQNVAGAMFFYDEDDYY